MRKNKILTAAAAGVAAVFVAVIIAMSASGKFDALKQNFQEEQTTLFSSEVSTAPAAVHRGPKSPFPTGATAAVYRNYSEKSAAELADFSKFGFNAVIFDLTGVVPRDLSPLLGAARTNKLYYGVRKSLIDGDEAVLDFVKNNDCDFIILCGSDETMTGYPERVGALCDKIRSLDPAISIGLEPVYVSKASDSVLGLVASRRAGFVFLFQKNDKLAVLKSAQDVWNEESAPLWICHNLKGLASISTESAAQTIELIARSADMSALKALAFQSYSDVAGARGKNAEIILEYIKKRDSYLLDKNFSLSSPKSRNITVEQSSIAFKGTSSPLYDLLCNGKKTNVAKNGDFSVDVNLKPGKNVVKFEHKGKTYVYNVSYKIKLLKSVSPSDSITVPGEMSVEISAIAHKKAKLTVAFNGKIYEASAVSASSDSCDASPDADSDFTKFTVSVKTPPGSDSVQRLGKFSATAKYNGLSETLKGAEINVSAREPAAPPPPPPPASTSASASASASTSASTSTSTSVAPTFSTSAQAADVSGTENVSVEPVSPAPTSESSVSAGEALQRYYYSKNYGLGTARICEIIDDYVETYPGDTTSVFSVPDCSPLLRGTSDYVVSEAVYDGDKYYILASGVKVPLLREERLASGEIGAITHLKIVNGYRTPKNSIKVVSSSVTDGEVSIVLDMNKPVAFNARLLGQTYSLYNGRPVVVAEPNYTGLEFTFGDSASAEGDVSLNGSVCKKASWSSDSARSTVSLTFEFLQKGKFYGFRYEYDDAGRLVITVKRKPPSSLKGCVAALDPGHGGIDSGAVCSVSSSSFGLEKQLNISIAAKLKERLEAKGARVIMTRTGDKWTSYAERNEEVRKRRPDIFISIHCDSSSSAGARGTSAYYYRAYSQPLAKSVHARIVEAYKNSIYKNQPEEIINKISRGANFYAFRVTRVEECPAILVEYGFVSNIEECQILQTAANRDILADATAEGIADYLASN